MLGNGGEEELAGLVQTIKNTNPGRIEGRDGEQSILLHPHDIDYVFAEKRKVYAVSDKQNKIAFVPRLVFYLYDYQFPRDEKV